MSAPRRARAPASRPAPHALPRPVPPAIPHQAVVLAAGEGLRLRPVTAEHPKPLLPIGNVPQLRVLLERLREAGVARVAVNAYFRAAEVVRAVASWPLAGVETHVEVEPFLRGTGGALAGLRAWLHDAPTLLLTGDVVLDPPFAALAGAHARRRAEATMLLSTRGDVARFGAVHADAQGRLRDVAGLLGRGGPRVAVNASVHVLAPSFVARFPADRPACLVRDGYVPALAEGRALAGLRWDGAWHETGTFDGWLAAHDALLAGEVTLPAALRDDAGWPPRARGGLRPSLVHPEADLAPDARLDACTVGARAVVGGRADLRRCLVLPGARVAAGTRAADTVIGAPAGAACPEAASGPRTIRSPAPPPRSP